MEVGSLGGSWLVRAQFDIHSHAFLASLSVREGLLGCVDLVLSILYCFLLFELLSVSLLGCKSAASHPVGGRGLWRGTPLRVAPLRLSNSIPVLRVLQARGL